jgi:NADPH2:quinone reductase
MADSIRAARLHEHGQPLAIESVELPPPREGEIRVELDFAGVNPVDRYVADGRVATDGPQPRTLGGEAGGTVDGRSVLLAGEGLGSARDGVWAEAAVVPAAAVVDLPDGVSTRDAAAMGVAGLTGWKVVREVAAVSADDHVLVLGAAGGVGSVIVSLADAAGATVWGQTGSEEKTEAVRSQGADRAIVAGPDQLAEAVAELEPTVVFDPLANGFVQPALDALCVRGRYVSFGTSAGPEVTLNMQTLYRKMISLLGYAGMQLGRAERRAGLVDALESLRAGELKMLIDEVLPLEQVNEAFARIEQRQVRGKLLLGMR